MAYQRRRGYRSSGPRWSGVFRRTGMVVPRMFSSWRRRPRRRKKAGAKGGAMGGTATKVMTGLTIAGAVAFLIANVSELKGKFISA